MALKERTGQFGTYWGDEYNSSHALSTSQMKENAQYIFVYLKNIGGWSTRAICGLLGNMQYESSINPGRWQSDNVGGGPAYGLVQWDPYTKYTNWATNRGNDPSTMDSNLERILYEVANNIQYYATSSYPESFTEYTTSNESPYYLACAFAWNYERSWTVLYGTEAEKEALRQKRGNAANEWYRFLIGEEPPEGGGGGGSETPDTPTQTSEKKRKYKFILFSRKRNING